MCEDYATFPVSENKIEDGRGEGNYNIWCYCGYRN